MPALEREPKNLPLGAAENVAFAIIMTLAAYLGRANPNFVYPEILWSFLALLVFNLANFLHVFRRLKVSMRNRLTVAANILLVTLIIRYSGETESYFWVMYLLPIFSAALSSRRRGILATGVFIFLALAVFYSNSIREAIWPEIIELFTKTATLLAAASVTARVAFRERFSREELAKEKANALRERIKMREQIQHMDRLATLGTLSASITHELKTPLSAIIGFAEIARDPRTASTDVVGIVDRIDRRAVRCIEIIEDMLSFARRQKKEKAPTDLNALVHKCVDLKRYDWFDNKLGVKEDYEPALPQVAIAAAEIQQVVFNLLTNAEQAIGLKPGGAGSIRVSTKSGPKKILVRVEDDGPGISPEVMKKIWEPFFTTKPAGMGTGLGLPICRQILEEHGGTLSADSEEGRYAAFTIELPRSTPS